MTSQKQAVSDKFSDIIKVLNSGIDFYKEAIDEVTHADLKELFSRVMMSHKKSVARLQPYVVINDGEVEEGSSFAVEARRVYTNILTSIKDNDNLTLVDQLEEVEDKLLAEIKEALELDMTPACASALTDVRTDVRVCHDLMRRAQRKEESLAS